MNNKIKIYVIPMGELSTNATVIANGSSCVIFDPDGDTDTWINWLSAHSLMLVAIYLTHGHYDHMGAVADLTEKFQIPWYLHTDDKPIILLNNTVGRLFGASRIKHPRAASMPLVSGQIEILPDVMAEFISTPGHTPGSGIFYIHDLDLLVAGDTIFADAVGRCDLPMGSWSKMEQSITEIKSLTLPPDTRIITGHGPESTIGDVMRYNRFFI